MAEGNIGTGRTSLGATIALCGWAGFLDLRVLCQELCSGLIALYQPGQGAEVLLSLFKYSGRRGLNILEIFASFLNTQRQGQGYVYSYQPQNVSMNVSMQELGHFLEHSKVPLPLRTMMTEMSRRHWIERGSCYLQMS